MGRTLFKFVHLNFAAYNNLNTPEYCPELLLLTTTIKNIFLEIENKAKIYFIKYKYLMEIRWKKLKIRNDAWQNKTEIK